jgi:hypothetical protein
MTERERREHVKLEAMIFLMAMVFAALIFVFVLGWKP